MPRHIIIAVTSLAHEALIARGIGVSVVCSQSCRLGAALNGTLSSGVSGIISFGISGGLHPELVAGDWVVASAVRYGDRVFATDLKWAQELAKRLPGAILASSVLVSAGQGQWAVFHFRVNTRPVRMCFKSKRRLARDSFRRRPS